MLSKDRFHTNFQHYRMSVYYCIVIESITRMNLLNIQLYGYY